MNITTKILLCLTVGTLCIGCSRQHTQLEEALELSGQNRAELQRVLDHFEGDSLKHEAAKFLIANMPGHYSYADTAWANRYYNSVDSMFDAFHGQTIDSLRIEINDIASRWDVGSIPYVQDVEIISADFLIANIDDAFAQWEESPWCSHLSFDEFCEYILPYKSEELQPFDNWRSEFKGLCTGCLHNLRYADLFKNSTFRAASLLNQALADKFGTNLLQSVDWTVYRTRTRIRIPFGVCEDYVRRTNVIFRSIGIPIVMEFIPKWGHSDIGHDWNVILSRKGMEIPFCGMCSTPKEYHKPYENMPKAFRRTYAQNPALVALNASGEYVPKLFRNIFMRDVTQHHTAVCKLDFDLPDEPDGYAYLAVANGKDWSPVDFTMIKNGKAIFSNIGRENICAVVRYDTDGIQHVISTPVRIAANGCVSTLNPDMSFKQSVELRRKYPVLEYVFVEAEKMVGGEFQADDTVGFSNPKVAFHIDDANSEGMEVMVADSVGAHRYWRYINERPGTNSNIAEIAFFDSDGNRVQGTPIGSTPLWNCADYGHDKAFDGKLLTRFTADADHGGWVGMDFGKPVDIRKIHYYARGDGNSIEPGDLYELFFWDSSGWRSLGRKKATGTTLVFDNVPANALLILRDLTKGKDERVFTCTGTGRQLWW